MARKATNKQEEIIDNDLLEEDVDIIDETDSSEEIDLDSLSDEELEALAQRLEAEEDADSSIEEEAEGAGGVPADAAATNMKSVAMKAVAAMTPDQVAGFLKSIQKPDDMIPDGTAEKNQASIAMKGAIQEDLQTLFGDNESLTEDFKNKMTVLFESAVATRVSLLEDELANEYAAALEEEVVQITENLVATVDKYLTNISEEWMENNKAAVESNLRADLAEEFMQGLYDLFERCHIKLPDDKVDVAEMLANKVEELEDQLNESIESSIALREQLAAYEVNAMIDEKTTGLTVSQAEKFKTLAESIDFSGDVEDFAKKLDVIKEHHFASNKKKADTNLITEEFIGGEDDEAQPETVVRDPAMRSYLAAIKRTSIK